MVTFNFSLSAIKKKEKNKPKTNVVTTVEGIVAIVNNEYKLKVDNSLYDIDKNSIATKGKRIIYAKRLDEYGHRIKIIRNGEDAFDVGSEHYSSIAIGLKVKTNVSIINNKKVCAITKIYHDTLLNDIEIETIKEMFFEYD